MLTKVPKNFYDKRNTAECDTVGFKIEEVSQICEKEGTRESSSSTNAK